MPRWVFDEDFNNDIVRSLFRRKPSLDAVRVQDVGLSGADDPVILEWAAQHKRILLTHDAATMTKHTYDRLRQGQPVAGVFEVSQALAILPVVEDILLLEEGSREGEWEGQIHYLPL